MIHAVSLPSVFACGQVCAAEVTEIRAELITQCHQVLRTNIQLAMETLRRHMDSPCLGRMVEGEETHDFLQWHGLQRTLMVILFLVLFLVVQWLYDMVVQSTYISDETKARISQRLAEADKCFIDGADEYLQLLDVASNAMRSLCNMTQECCY